MSGSRVKYQRAKVESVTQSPMNGRRWLLQLDCGHELWLTATSRPQRKTAICLKCTDALRAAPGRGTA
jgi:hypothetical protein